jgi:hypothetical protein
MPDAAEGPFGVWDLPVTYGLHNRRIDLRMGAEVTRR